MLRQSILADALAARVSFEEPMLLALPAAFILAAVVATILVKKGY